MSAAPPPEVQYAVWRRPRGRAGWAWERLPGTHATRTEALHAVTAAELTRPRDSEAERAPEGFEYEVQPEGRAPASWPQHYRHRMMHPQYRCT